MRLKNVIVISHTKLQISECERVQEINVRERVEVTERNKVWFPPFPYYLENRQCLRKKSLIEKKTKGDFLTLDSNFHK